MNLRGIPRRGRLCRCNGDGVVRRRILKSRERIRFENRTVRRALDLVISTIIAAAISAAPAAAAAAAAAATVARILRRHPAIR